VEPQLPRCLEVTWGVIEEEAFLGDSLRLASWPLVVGRFICFDLRNMEDGYAASKGTLVLAGHQNESAVSTTNTGDGGATLTLTVSLSWGGRVSFSVVLPPWSLLSPLATMTTKKHPQRTEERNAQRLG